MYLNFQTSPQSTNFITLLVLFNFQVLLGRFKEDCLSHLTIMQEN